MSNPAIDAALRHEVKRAYKELLYMGREYPLGYLFFRQRLHAAFMNQAHLVDTTAIRNGLARADHVKKGVHYDSTTTGITQCPRMSIEGIKHAQTSKLNCS